jgi:hypothetical protein
MEKIVKQHIQLDQEGKAKSGLNPTAAAYVYDEEYRKRHVERLEKKLSVLNKFLAGAGPRRGAGGEAVKSNITDNESALIKGAHGYIQGYNGIGGGGQRESGDGGGGSVWERERKRTISRDAGQAQ